MDKRKRKWNDLDLGLTTLCLLVLVLYFFGLAVGYSKKGIDLSSDLSCSSRMNKQKIVSAILVEDLTFREPHTKDRVELVVYQDTDTGYYFGVDSSWALENEPQFAFTPHGSKVELVDDPDVSGE